jgi:hypothetical protein
MSEIGIPTRIGPGLAGHRHQPAHALHHLVDAGPVLVGAVLAERRDAGVDQPRILRRQRLVVELEPRLHVGPEVLDQHVGPLDHLVKDRAALVAAQVERHAALVAVLVLEVGLVAGGEILRIARTLDPHHVGAPVGKLAHADRTRARVGHVDDGKPFEGAGSRLVPHSGVLSSTLR